MEEYLNKIIKLNSEMFNELKIIKINSGFTNLVYSVGDKYILKICTNKNNEERFKNEINFYLNNKDNKYIPKLFKYYISENNNDYSYEIIEKIKGKSLYYLWHLYDENKRKSIIKEISNMLKLIHSIKGKKYDWSLFIKNKLIKDLENCNKNNVFNDKEKKNLEYVINNCSNFLNTTDFSLVHSDLHFDNILIDENDNIKLIDFETSIFAPIDYELDIFLRMCNNPIKYSSEETEKYIENEDYKYIPKYLKEFYPEIFNFKYFKTRHLIYDLEANIRLLARFPEDKELFNLVIKITKKIINEYKYFYEL